MTKSTDRGSIGQETIYWHRELPPVEAESVGEHTLEASSKRVRDTLSDREELWRSCYDDLMRDLDVRMAQELARLGGDCAHILDETIDTRHDSVSGEAWLHGRFTYMLYRRPRATGRRREPPRSECPDETDSR